MSANSNLHADPYLNDSIVIDRLMKEYYNHSSLIIALDFDGTINDFHKEGFIFPEVINLIKLAKKLNCYIFIFTAFPDEEYVKNYCKTNDIPFDAINDSSIKTNMNNKKPYYNILLDDRAGLSSAFNVLSVVLSKIYAEKC